MLLEGAKMEEVEQDGEPLGEVADEVKEKPEPEMDAGEAAASQEVRASIE